jgi:hypothetical protein
MTEDGVNKRATEIVNELIVYNKIKISVKNIWAEKIIDFLLNEKKDYNLFQHSKVMKSIPNYPAEEGIAQLLENITHVNSVPEANMLEDKKSELSVKEQWDVDFNYMTFAQQYEKACGWLSCGCPERAIPVFIMNWVKSLAEEKQIAEMREKYKIGRKRCRYDDFKVTDLAKKLK